MTVPLAIIIIIVAAICAIWTELDMRNKEK